MNALIVLDVHSREVVDRLVQEKVRFSSSSCALFCFPINLNLTL
jgi:hypothetical protein